MLILFALLFGTTLARADFYELYDHKGDPHADYDRIVAGLRPGDSVHFSDGKTVTLSGRLGEGNSTVVFEILGNDSGVIRIPKRSNDLFFLHDFVRGQPALAHAGVPVVRIHFEDCDPVEYLVVDKVAMKFTLEEFLHRKQELSAAEKKRAWDSLVDFGARTWPFLEIGDFHPSQMCWDGTRWVLLDFTNAHTVFRPAQGPGKAPAKAPRSVSTVFSLFRNQLPQSIVLRIEAEVRKKRSELARKRLGASQPSETATGCARGLRAALASLFGK